MVIDPDCIYTKNPDIAVENFGDRSLLFQCADLRFVELNLTARDLLSRLNGETTVRQFAVAMAAEYNLSLDKMLFDVQNTLLRMNDLNIVRQVKINSLNKAAN